MIKNIIFDLGKVILLDKPNCVLNLIKLDNNKKRMIDDKFFQNWRDLDLGKKTLKKHWQDCNFDFEINDELENIITHYYKYRPINNEIIDLIINLKKDNYQIYILSNNNLDAKEYFMSLPFFQYIDGYVFSCDYGLLKPNPEIFQVLFDKYHLIPKESLFIDDKKKNIEVAELLGMKGFVFDYNIHRTIDIIKCLKK